MPAGAKAPHVVKGNADPFLNGAPFTFEQALRLVGQDAIPLSRRKAPIQSRGVDFAVSPEEAGKLKAAGASEDLLKLIQSKAKLVAATPAAMTKPHGGIAITCAPAECEINLNGSPRGSTKSGTLVIAGLAPGTWAVDVKKDGYVSHQSVVAVEGDKMVPLPVVLDPDRAAQEAFGSELLQKVVQALGGADGLKELASLQAMGSTTVGTRDGKSVRWTVLMRNRPDRALFQAKAGGKLYEAAFSGSEYTTSKNMKGQEALELPTDFGLIRDHQLAALMSRLENRQFKVLASHPLPAAGEEFILFAEDGAEKISIGLDDELRPQRVRIATATGVGSANIAYSDYAKNEKTSYPKTLQIKPDGWQQGIEVRFDTVELSPNLKDTDYKLKGKALAELGK